jgi:NADH:ubiquinone oxidoreductase subunit 3 (subunit A)
LFLYPWAVASHHPHGIDAAIAAGDVSGRGIVFGGVLFFLLLVVAGLVYEWRKGVLRWR